MAGLRLHDDQVAGLDALAGSIDIKSFAGILETNLKKVSVLFLADALEVVVHLQLAAALAVADLLHAGILVAADHAAPGAVISHILVGVYHNVVI